jgi:hypothetical protein
MFAKPLPLRTQFFLVGPWPWPKAEEGGAAQGMDDVDPAREASDLDIPSSTSGIDMSTNYEVF